MKVIIIDDEQKARILLREMLLELEEEIEIVADCHDLPNGIKAIRKLKPDLIFLDIEMPGHSGLEILDFFNDEEINFSIIFVTAYNQYAIRAFKVSAIDYLLKPIASSDLIEAIDRFKKQGKRLRLDYAALKDNLTQSLSNKIAVPTGNEIRFIEFSTILYLKADSSYTEIYFTDNSKLLVSRTLRNFEEVLTSNNGFFRCQKSYMINVNYISNYVKSEGGFIVMKNEARVPISPEKSGELLDLLQMIKR